MATPIEKYRNNARYHHHVEALQQLALMSGLSLSDVREAAFFATFELQLQATNYHPQIIPTELQSRILRWFETDHDAKKIQTLKENADGNQEENDSPSSTAAISAEPGPGEGPSSEQTPNEDNRAGSRKH